MEAHGVLGEQKAAESNQSAWGLGGGGVGLGPKEEDPSLQGWFTDPHWHGLICWLIDACALLFVEFLSTTSASFTLIIKESREQIGVDFK